MKKNISILVLSMMGGGAERLVSILLLQLKKEYNLTLVMVYGGSEYDIPKDIQVIELGKKENMNENGLLKLLRLFWVPFQYKSICKKYHTDISFSLLNRANYINILSGIIGNSAKIIISERAMPSLQHKDGIQGKINRFLIKKLYPLADIVTSNSEGNALDLKNNFGMDKVKVLNNMFDIEEIKKIANKDIELSLDLSKFTFITVGRLDRGKNHKVIIEVMKDIDANLIIVGEGVLNESLNKLITEYRLEKRVILIGFDSNPYKYMNISNVFVFASLHEGFPNVLIEAMACGLPIISSDCKSSPREILSPSTDIDMQLTDSIESGEYGVLTPLDNKIYLEKAMNLLLENKNLLQKYQQQSLRRAQDFSIDKIVNQYKEVLCVE